jgi:uncharacterized protein YabE (DUF348 family)
MNSASTPQATRLLRWLATVAVAGLVVLVSAVCYLNTRKCVTVVVDGSEWQLHTHQDSVGGALLDAGLDLAPEDLLFHGTPVTGSAFGVPLNPEQPIEVERARLVVISADGHKALLRTHASSAEEALLEARVSLLAGDELSVEGAFLAAESPGDPPPAVELTVNRALAFTVYDNGQSSTHYTTASTVGEALQEAGFALYVADAVSPELGQPMLPGLSVRLDRSVPITVRVDGQTLATRSLRRRVGELLAQLGIVLAGQDRTVPPAETDIDEDVPDVAVVRVSEELVVEQEPIPFDTVWQPDPDLELDTIVHYQDGVRGVLERRVRVRYEDGIPVERRIEHEYLALEPVPSIEAYGTRIVTRTMETPHGMIEYWRKIRMLATSYSASTAGTPRDSPWYGWTRMGLRMRHGLVAVDPAVVNLMSKVYVPGYGPGLAADTGGAINGRRIDLGYDDDNLVMWLKWVNVYVLTPVPPADEINYVIPP